MTKKTLNRRGIGEKSSLLLSQLAENNKAIFDTNDAMAILKERRGSVHKLLHDLAKKKWLFKITKGKYLILPLEAGANPKFTEHEFVIAAALIDPYYISYWPAINYYGLTEQPPKTIFVATTKRKNGIKILGVNIKFITIKKNKFFGYKRLMIGSHFVNIADLEKAIIDCLDKPRNCGGVAEIIKAIYNAKDEINLEKLEGYAKKMHDFAIVNRLGYILDLLGIETKLKPGKHYVHLEPMLKKTGNYNNKWKIIENVPRKELLSWKES